MKPLLILGGNGQLGRAFQKLCPEAVFLDRESADMSKPESLRPVIDKVDPSAIINATAYTQVDKAEEEEALADKVNAESPKVVAQYCKDKLIPFVHFSTDYVFDGSGDAPWTEDDEPRPLNAYGRSKLKGEEAIRALKGHHLIFRTSWVYDAQGKNFLNTILRLASEREELKIIDDQFGAPTYAPHLAAGSVAALIEAQNHQRFPSSVFHMCGAGVTSWHGFASAIIAEATKIGLPVNVKNIKPIPATEYPLPARRPYNSRLDCTKALSMFGVELPPWQDALAECMELKA